MMTRLENFEGDALMTVIEGHCPIHEQECELVEVAGTPEWLDQHGYTEDYEGSAEISVWSRNLDEDGLLTYCCPQGCTLNAWNLKHGDWVANGQVANNTPWPGARKDFHRLPPHEHYD